MYVYIYIYILLVRGGRESSLESRMCSAFLSLERTLLKTAAQEASREK